MSNSLSTLLAINLYEEVFTITSEQPAQNLEPAIAPYSFFVSSFCVGLMCNLVLQEVVYKNLSPLLLNQSIQEEPDSIGEMNHYLLWSFCKHLVICL